MVGFWVSVLSIKLSTVLLTDSGSGVTTGGCTVSGEVLIVGLGPVLEVSVSWSGSELSSFFLNDA